MTKKRKNCIILIITATVLLSGCSGDNGNMRAADAADSACETVGNYRVVSSEEKESWRAPLIALLQTLCPRGTQDDSSYDYLATSYGAALLDIDVDGTPELLDLYPGGSAGNAFYEVYDLYSQSCIGCLQGGWENSWQTYCDAQTGVCKTFGRYEHRCGYGERDRYVTEAVMTKNGDTSATSVTENEIFHTVTVISSAWPDVGSETDDGETFCYDETYETYYYYKGARTYYDTYMPQYDDFTQNYAAIPGTGICIFTWDDVSDETDSQTVSAEKMAQALLSSSQVFAAPK